LQIYTGQTDTIFSATKRTLIVNRNLIAAALTPLLIFSLASTAVVAQDAATSTNSAVRPALPPLPAAMNAPKPGPVSDAPYAPQPILPGGVVVPLWPPGSPYLNPARVKEAEQYTMSRGVPGRIVNIVNIHNPSIEIHTVEGGGGAALILAAGGGHTTLNVGPESADFVPFFFNYGVTTIILRNRLKRDGYNPLTDEIYDAQQAIRLVRAHAKEWRIDPNKIGIMGFSAGAELSAPAALFFDDFDKKNSDPSDPLAGISSRPDFVGILYPGPSPFRDHPDTPVPANTPPAFIACAGSGDRQHAVWADQYFSAMITNGVPNVEMHIYGDGTHAGALSDRHDTPFGTWQLRFIDWFRDLGFLNKSGEQTKAAKDVETYMKQPPPRAEGGARRAQNAAAAAAPPSAAPTR